jgi:hypothetical protein
VAGEFVALLTMETLPATLPAAVGANVTLKLVFYPAANVRGRESPLILKPAPVTAAWEIVRVAVPPFLRVTGRVPLLPISTFPKSVLLGLALSRRFRPEPESEIVAGELVALLTTEMLPVAPPPAVGAKTTLKPTVCPEFSVSGGVSPLILKAGPLTLT